jgi:arsenate reductase-like glutaredoxin family protein
MVRDKARNQDEIREVLKAMGHDLDEIARTKRGFYQRLQIAKRRTQAIQPTPDKRSRLD